MCHYAKLLYLPPFSTCFDSPPLSFPLTQMVKDALNAKIGAMGNQLNQQKASMEGLTSM